MKKQALLDLKHWSEGEKDTLSSKIFSTLAEGDRNTEIFLHSIFPEHVAVFNAFLILGERIYEGHYI